MRSDITHAVDPQQIHQKAKEAKQRKRIADAKALAHEMGLDHDPSTNEIKLNPEAVAAITKAFRDKGPQAVKAALKAALQKEEARAKAQAAAPKDKPAPRKEVVAPKVSKEQSNGKPKDGEK